MLRFERRVVAAMTEAGDRRPREEVEDFVDGTLATMPEHLRAGLALASVGLGAIARAVDLATAPPPSEGRDRFVAGLERLRFGPVQQYLRVFRSLVLFAEHETSPEPST